MQIMMDYSLIYMTVMSAGLIVLMLLLRKFFVKQIPKIWLIAAWVLILLRLLLPFRIVIPILPKSILSDFIMWINELPSSGFLVVWLAGVVISAAFFGIHYIACRRILREAIPIQAVPNLDEEMFTFMGIRVFVSDRIVSPITYGVVRQKVILPKYYTMMTREQLKYILIHEKIHIDRHDNLNKFLIIVAVCLHWFNPLVWLMYYYYNRDMELACDEKVIRQVGADKRSDYAEALISMAEQEHSVPLYSAFGKSAIKERVFLIMKYKKSSLFSIVLCLLFLIPTIFAFTVPEAEANSSVVTMEEVVSYQDVCDVKEVLEEDEYKTKASVMVENRDGIEICFRLWLKRGFAATHGKIMMDYLPEGETWQPGVDSAFAGKIVVPDAVRYKGELYPVTSIGAYSFYKCKNVREILLPDTITEIKEFAFTDCRGLRELHLPPSLQLVETNPFTGCTSLERFVIEGEGQGQYKTKDGILYTDYGRFLKVYPQGRKEAVVRIKKPVNRVAIKAFYGLQAEKVVFPDSVYQIKKRAFMKCPDLKTVSVPNSSVFKRSMFRNCPNAKIKKRKK